MIKLCLLLLQVLFLIPVSLFAHSNGKVTITIEPVFNGAPLKPGEQAYVNQHGDTLSVDLFRFYMTQIGLTRVNSKTTDVCMICSHLVNAEDTASCSFTLDFPEGNYETLSFILGVDSIANTSGANSGDLDPAKGMYWAWNTGYIMAKIEGASKVCKTLHHAFEFHIGGYMPPFNTARHIDLLLPATLVISNDKAAHITIKANVAAWFQGVDLAQLNSIVTPGKPAMEMADRYAKMFTIAGISRD